MIHRRFLLLALTLLLPACAAADVPAFSVQLDWTYDAQFAGLLVAEHNGYFKDAGVKVTILPVDDNMATSQQVVAHTNWIGVSEADVVIVDRAKGTPIKAFAAMMQTTPFALITLKGSGIHSVSDLRGKKIGLYADGQKAIDVVLGYNHMTRKDVTIVQIPYGLDNLLKGRVDAIQGYVTGEVVQLEMAGHPVNVIPFGENGYTSYAEVLFTSEKTMAAQGPGLALFVEAVKRGWRYALDHPDDTAAILANDYHADGGLAVQRAELDRVLPLVTYESRSPDHLLRMKRETWEKAFAMFRQFQFFDSRLTVDDLVVFNQK